MLPGDGFKRETNVRLLADTFPRVGRLETRYVLRGRIVTLDAKSAVVASGNVCIRDDVIEAVTSINSEVPDGFKDSPIVETNGTIYPGLVDLHNHFAYNIRELWTIPDRFDNREQWQATQAYRTEVSSPCKAIANDATTAKALVRFIEAKAIVGGTTTGQGILSKINGKYSYFNGVMRNVEQPNDARLPEAVTRIPDLKTEKDFSDFRTWLASRVAVFYHLCEGIDGQARVHFDELLKRDLIQRPLVGIHSLALANKQFQTLADHSSKVIWSPLSNLLLYGSTLDVTALLGSGVEFGLGCDWSPSGSKNLLMEAKVAKYVLKEHGLSCTAEDLVRMMTIRPARSAGWDRYIGSIEGGKLADFLVLEGSAGDPYEQLVDATEEDIHLVVVGGSGIFGLTSLMDKLAGGAALEPFPDAKVEKCFNILVAGSGIEDVTLAAARATLTDAMSNPRELARRQLRVLLSRDIYSRIALESFQVALDNEHPTDDDETYYEHLLELLKSGISLTLDSMLVGPGDLARLDSQPNIKGGLKTYLRQYYS